MKTCLLIIISFLLSVTPTHSQDIQLPKLRKELLKMRKVDQKLRGKLVSNMKKGKTDTKKNTNLLIKVRSVDRTNTQRLREIIEEYGWPTIDMVGERASNSAWLIAQHADRNPLFQGYCLQLIKEALEEKRVAPSNYAYLYDRYHLAKGEKQLYATQTTRNEFTKTSFFQTIEDESNVQKRREEMSISKHIEDYAQSNGFEYKILTKEEADKKLEGIRIAYEENISKAKEAMNDKDYTVAAKHYIQALYSDGFTKSEDYVETARTISLSQHEDSNWAYYYLIKAAVKGWDKINEFNTNKDFEYIKNKNPNSWQDLMNVVNEVNGTD